MSRRKGDGSAAVRRRAGKIGKTGKIGKARAETPAPPDIGSEPDEQPPGGSFPIVGVGASAGGLEAFTQLLAALPPDTGMGFVLIQHLDPQHESALVQILARATKLPVREAKEGELVLANHVYVIPRATDLSIVKGVLKLEARPRARAPHRPIDAFFESLAQDRRQRSVGVVLSGTATDGTLGLEAIKAEGGITFAQDDSAKYDSMPKSAVAAGCVDLVLPPAEIARELARIARHPSVTGQPLPKPVDETAAGATEHADGGTPLPLGDRGSPAQAEKALGKAERGQGLGTKGLDAYKKILLVLRDHSGVDFSLYKSTTIQRRVTRRLVLNKQDTLEDYAQFLRGNTKELDTLFSDVLISVTSFFRNPETFDALQRKVLSELVKQRGDDPLRCWVLGCSTGQEAYSIAMAFVEAAEKAPRMRRIQIFATDLNEALLEKARHGLYAKSLVEDVTPERLRRFFAEEGGGYRISKALRDMVVFARQNVISDPPFSRMDLISCRNLLIYLEPSLQKKAMPTFHYALKPGGFLLLGASESVGGFTDLFEAVDKKQKIYCKKAALTPAYHLPLQKQRGGDDGDGPPSPHPPLTTPPGSGGYLAEGPRGELNAQREADRIAVSQFAPPAVLVNAELQVLQFRGPTGPFLEPASGKASFDVLKMARKGLLLPLRGAINEARKENKTARKDNVRVDRNGASRTVSLEVIPLKNLPEPCFLIVFEDGEKQGRSDEVGLLKTGSRAPREIAPVTAEQESGRITELETELTETREYLQAMQEQHEAANEELQAANEEVQSANEELQSVNEELETSKEELESANEELTTVNEEMSNRNVELNRLNNDLTNLQTSTKLPIVLLGRDLTVRRFSPQAEKQLDLMVADVGRPISQIRHNLVLDDAGGPLLDLGSLSAAVISEVREQEREVCDSHGRWYLLRVRPYLTVESKVDGAVLVLVDITERKRAEEVPARLAAIVTSSDDAIISKDLRGIIQTWNEGATRLYGYAAEEAIGKPTTLLIPPDRLDEDPAILERVRRGEIVDHYETVRRRKDGRLLDISLTVSPIRDAAGRVIGAAKIARDITDRKRVEEALQKSHAALQSRAEALARFNRAAVGRELRMTELKQEVNELSLRMGGGARYALESAEVDELAASPERAPVGSDGREGLRDGLAYEAADLKRHQESTRAAMNLMEDAVAARGAMEASAKEARASEERLRFTLEATEVGAWDLDLATDTAHRSPRHDQIFGYDAPLPEWGYQRFLKHVHPDDRALVAEKWQQALADGSRLAFECRIVRADQAVRWIWVRGNVSRDASGKPQRMSGLVMDVTERKRMETELRQFGADLSDAASRRGEFLAMLGHELRNPLAAMTYGLARMRKVHDDRPRLEELQGMLIRQTGHITALVDQLLDIARVVSGKVEIAQDRVDLADVVRAAVETAGPLTEAQKHEITLALPAGTSVFVRGDAVRLTQVVENLLTNALKYTDAGGKIAVSLESDKDKVRITVRDTGIGMNAELLPHIFEVFTQAPRALDRSQGGLGLGLPLVRRLVEMHGGRVSASSPGPGQGSEFVVTLPLLHETRSKKRLVRAPAPTAPSESRPRRILVVDDQEDAAHALAELLEEDGHHALAVNDGPAGLAAVRSFDPEVVILDLGLPGMDGYEVARRLRQENAGKRIFLIAITGYQSNQARLEEVGFDQHVLKPPNLQHLSALIARWDGGDSGGEATS